MIACALALIQPAVLPWVTADAKVPGVAFRTFESKAAGSKVSVHIALPDDYSKEPDRRFPVVYWLHGTGGGLMGIRPLSQKFGASMKEGKMPPSILVFVNGLPGGMYVDWKDGKAKVESMIIQDLVPWVDKEYRTIADRNGRMLEGFSMGGYGAARLGFKHSSLFGSVSMLGAGPLQPRLEQTPRAAPESRQEILRRVYGGDQEFFYQQSPWKLAEAIKEPVRLRMIIGTRDETYGFNQAFHRRLMDLKVKVDFLEVPDVAHDTLALLDALGDRMWAFHRAAFAHSAPDKNGPASSE